MNRDTCGWAFWAGVAGWLIGWDVPAVRRGFETGSCAFGRAVVRHPVLVGAGWLMLSAHLFGVLLPPQVRRLDPLGYLARALTPKGPVT